MRPTPDYSAWYDYTDSVYEPSEDSFVFLDGIEKIFKVQYEDTKDKDTMARSEDNIKEHHDLEEASWWKVVRHKVPKW